MANQQERAELHKTIWKIVSYIESQTARLDKSIEKAEHQIELLQELKQENEK